MTTQDFPCDLDTTSIGLTVTDHVDAATKCSVMDEMLKYVNEDGTIQVSYPLSALLLTNLHKFHRYISTTPDHAWIPLSV